MTEPHQPKQEQVFVLRLWRERLDGQESEWRGKIQLISGGEARYFRDWNTLVEWLVEVLPKVGQ